VKALDLFCKAGGATRGLQQAGYHVTGVDIEPQPRYCGDRFFCDDAFAWLRGQREPLDSFDLIWGSPKCQGHSVLTPTSHKAAHEIQLPDVLEALRAQPVPYIVENVEGTQGYMRNPIMLCGSMFGLDVWRHRWFELGNTDAFFLLPSCDHSFAPVVVSGRGMRIVNGKRWSGSTTPEKRRGMNIDWMSTDELEQAIPPAYARFLALAMQEHAHANADA
jgi:DNA (cytosine-5)-methyltransferase 1